MSFLDDVRADREPLAHVLKKHRGIRKIVEDLYPDQAHFIYELLQNAEDTGASEAAFVLSDNSLSFEHNGRPFTEKDILAITDIGEGTKAEDDDKIGRFGVGFKAVFAYSETPHIWCPTFAFKISDLVLPTQIAAKAEFGQGTRFEFPFNNPKKAPPDAYAEILSGLKQLAETTLLFLSHLESIQWQIGGTSGIILRVSHTENHIEVLKQTDGKTTSESHFLRFSTPVQSLERQKLSVAYELDRLPNNSGKFDPSKSISNQMKIVSANPGRVAVFFPAEGEVSGLRFHLHAPFVPDLSRALVKETAVNEPLFAQIARLAASSLHGVRDLGLLTIDFLSVLPSSHDDIPQRYTPIRDAVVVEMNHEALTPTHSRSHAPAQQLLQARVLLKELLSEESDLATLAVSDDAPPPRWAASAAQKNSNADRFLSSLAIKEWDVPQFIKRIEEMLDDEESGFDSWIVGKTLGWHQHFYAVLRANIFSRSSAALRKYDLEQLKRLRIIRLINGQYSVAAECFFPTEGGLHDEILPRVDPAVYSSGKGKNQQEESRKLLEELGVREVGRTEEVQAILKKRYTFDNLKPNPKDLKRFIALIDKDPTQAKIFKDFHIFEGEDKLWATPGKVFLDRPYHQTDLRSFFQAAYGTAPKSALSGSYLEIGISKDRLVKFAEAVGVQTRLEMEAQSTRDHPLRSELRVDYNQPGVRWTDTHCDEDWIFPELESLLDKISTEVSRLIWNTMCHVGRKFLTATFRPNSRYPLREMPSSLVLSLREAEWVAQVDGRFVCPCDASRDLLPDGFPFDSGHKWLETVEFGKAEYERSEEHQQRQKRAEDLGFSDLDALQRARTFTSLPLEEQERILAENVRKEQFELPEKDLPNPERRREAVKKNAAKAQKRESEIHERSLQLGRETVKAEADPYLRDQYTNPDHEMICQICKAPLPFRLDGGQHYFEKVEFLDELKRRHPENYLALCPNHSAMFKYVNSKKDVMKDRFESMTGNELNVTLAQQDLTVYFTKTHIADILAVIEADKEEADVEAEPSLEAVGE